MSYVAVALARTTDGWTAREVDLDHAEDVDEVADILRDVDPDADVTLLVVEEDDEYLAIARVDAGNDEPRVFVSDASAADSHRIAELFTDAAEASARREQSDFEDDLADDAPVRESEPVGDGDLLADLGTRQRDLLALCAHEGMLPADVLSEVCDRAGCLDELEALRVP